MKPSSFRLTERDEILLQAIDRHPLTAEQLLRTSVGFPQPFSQLRLLQRRLKKLADGGLLKSFPYALLTGGAPRYYKLTRRGFHAINGEQAIPPTRRHFEAISPARHVHTHGLGEFLVCISVALSRRKFRWSKFARENSVKIETELGVAFPDCAFQIQNSQSNYNYFVEFDTGSERIRSTQDVESIERKLRIYDAYQLRYKALDPRRPVVVFVTKSPERLSHILQAAQEVLKNPRRTVIVGTTLKRCLLASDPLSEGFQDNRGRSRGLLPATKR